MARAKKTPGPGHNVTPLTEDEKSALVTHYELKIIESQRKVDAIQVDLKSARDVVNGHFKRMTADLGYTRQRFQVEVIDKLSMTDDEYAAFQAETAELHTIAGLRSGDQIDLVDHLLKDTVDETEAAKAHGFRSGRAALDPTPPDFIAPILHPAWLEAWHDGQAYNGAMLLKAADVLARPKPGEMAAAPDEPTDEDDGDDQIEAEVKRLEQEGWAQPTANEAEFVESDNGRTVRAA